VNDYIFFAGKRIARKTSSAAVYYYLEDHLGTSRAITDSSGNKCYDADFYPFGGERVITNTCPQNYKFTGKERDAESGNDDYGARYYASSLGRFLSPDWSAIPVPVPYANLSNPQTLNLYAMVSDNPETFADLDGHGQYGGFHLGIIGDAAVPTETSADALAMFDGAWDPSTFTTTPGVVFEVANSSATSSSAQNQNSQVGNTTVGALEKTMSNEDRSLSTPKKGDPDVLVDGKTALANAIINNAELDRPAKVAPATGTATTQDSQIMRDAATNRANGGADPVEGRTQYGTTHNPNIQSRSASNHLKGEAGRETVYEKFGPFRDSTSRRPTWIVIYNDPGH
jgi:RHS repeat-associated protein